MSDGKTSVKLPHLNSVTIDAHKKWLDILDAAETIVEEDLTLQNAASEGRRLIGRSIPPMLLGRCYVQYCTLINKMYDAYLNNLQLQRAPYILAIVAVLMKRMYEIRNELVHIIVNDYIYVDTALEQLKLTPFDIQIVVPYHFPVEARSENIEQLLQKMWADAIRRKRPKKPKPLALPRSVSRMSGVFSSQERVTGLAEEIEEDSPPLSVHTIISEEFIQAQLLQKHERFRQWYMLDFQAKCRIRRTYFTQHVVEAPLEMKVKAAQLIQTVYREYMRLKRKCVTDTQRDIKLGLLPDPCRACYRLDYTTENNKMYERQRKIRLKMKESYLLDLEKENKRLLFLNKEQQIEDITDQIREWFKEWYYGYGFFPEYPYETEGGTMLVITGNYPTVEDKVMQDELYQTKMKGMTKDMLKAERARQKAEAKINAENERKKRKKEADAFFKARCNPFADPGYEIKTSAFTDNLIKTLQQYRTLWSVYDQFPLEKFGEIVYGYMKNLLTEDLMCQIHKDCRIYVDELMRLDLKFLIETHQMMFKSLGLKYPKAKPRKKPKAPVLPKPFLLKDSQLKDIEQFFDLGIITKPTAQLKDVIGDLKYAAYDYNVKDPDASFPFPDYGDVKRRLVLSCILACGIQPGVQKNRSVMLLGPEKSGKSYLVDVVAGELNAVKIDITPETFSAVLDKPAKVLSKVFLAARAFQPAVIYMRNIERVFCKKVPPEQKYLQATILKPGLDKLVKQIAEKDKIIFIATCSNPFVAPGRQMAALFNEIVLMPRMEYGSLQKFFFEKLQGEISVPRDFPIQPLAHLCRGYGSGAVIQAYNDVMTAERICRISYMPLSPGEFINALLNKAELLSEEDYQKYVDFYIEHSPLKAEKQEYAIINMHRAEAYMKMAKKMATY